MHTIYALHCVVPAAGTLEFPENGVLPYAAGGLTALLSEVDEEEYCGPGAEARMQDLNWLGPRAYRHEALVEHMMGQGAVLPARFATLFTSLESVQGFLDRHRKAITEFLSFLGNRREWSVKGVWDLASAGRPEASAPTASGKEYLRQKRAQGEARSAPTRQLHARCEEAARELQQAACGFCERRVWNTPGDAPVVLNWAFLLSPAQGPAFRARVAGLNQRSHTEGLRLVLSGPWPPYSFAPQLVEAHA